MGYPGIDWKNKPNQTSPLNAANLEIMDTELVLLDSMFGQLTGEVGADGIITPTFKAGGLYSATGIEYATDSRSITPFLKVNPGNRLRINFNISGVATIHLFEFASNTTTASGVNERLARQDVYSGQDVNLTSSTFYIRLMITVAPENLTPVVIKEIQILADNTNLNNVTTPGEYVVKSAASAASMTNGPVTITGYKLVVLSNSNYNRITQIAYINSAGETYSSMMIRNYNGTVWTSWQEMASKTFVNNLVNTLSTQTLSASGITVTSSNYLTYFPNALFSDVKENTIMRIGANVPLTDGPEGDNWIGMPGRTRGYVSGTLIVFTPNKTPSSSNMSGVTQILIGYRDSASYKPTISYRTALYDNGNYIWSAWSKMEENGYLHASNTVIYGGNYADSYSDLNDLPSNTIYQIDLNNDESDASHTLGHNPAPGVSSVIMTYAYSYTTIHGKVQTVYTLDGRLYWRYGYMNDVDDYRWTSWRLCVVDDGNYIQNKGRLANGTNFNNVKENAIYLLGAQSSANYVNSPLNYSAGYLFVENNSAVCFQTVKSLGGDTFSRYTEDSGTTWSAWNKLLMDDGTIIKNKGTLESGADLNDVFENAIYCLGGQEYRQYVNNPLTTGAGYLTVKMNSSICLQVVESLGGTRFSRYSDDSGTNWSNWV